HRVEPASHMDGALIERLALYRHRSLPSYRRAIVVSNRLSAVQHNCFCLPGFLEFVLSGSRVALRCETVAGAWACHTVRARCYHSRLQSLPDGPPNDDEEIWDYNCPQCWTPCEANQSILGDLMRGSV